MTLGAGWWRLRWKTLGAGACAFGDLAFKELSERRCFIMAEENKGLDLAWLLVGLGVGALVGILCAPKSGRETREDIARGAREGSEYLSAHAKRAAEHVGTLVGKGKEQVGNYVERGWSLMEDQSNRVTAAVEAGREAYRTAKPSSE
jgi:gas vesicle protein